MKIARFTTSILAAIAFTRLGVADDAQTTKQPIRMTVEAEEVIYSGRYSNNGSCPMWCFNNTCVVRQGNDVFVSGYERVPGAKPMNDCRWFLSKRTQSGWERLWTDEKGLTREPAPLASLPGGQILLSANPTRRPATPSSFRMRAMRRQSGRCGAPTGSG